MNTRFTPQTSADRDAAPRWETVDQFCDRCQLSRPTEYDMIRRGMPSVTIGRARRIDPIAAMEWLRQRSDDAARPCAPRMDFPPRRATSTRSHLLENQETRRVPTEKERPGPTGPDPADQHAAQRSSQQTP